VWLLAPVSRWASDVGCKLKPMRHAANAKPDG